MGRRILMGTTLALVAAGLLWLDARLEPGVVALAVAAALGLAAHVELARMGHFRALAFGLPLRCAWIALAVFQFRALAAPRSYGPLEEFGLLYLVAGFGLLLGTIGGHLAARTGSRPSPAVLVLPLGLWLLPPIFMLVRIELEWGTLGLVVLVVLAKIGDNAGYFVGRAIGKRHPFPNLSPGKTAAGCVASLVAGIVAGAALLPFTLGERDLAGVLLGALVGGLVNVGAQAGDLSESWVKRKAGVKDSSTWLGPSGGVLDVIDSLFFAAPVALLLWSCLYAPAGG
jgi:phosphatidate cytidylyltransferase